jgi:hypothetical protein
MKYKLAFENINNCTDNRGHVFHFISDEEKIKEVRKEHPKLVYALWECVHCRKVKQSM